MGSDYVQPAYGVDGFNCPHCGAFAHQEWFRHMSSVQGGKALQMPDFEACRCVRCGEVTLWKEDTMIYPRESVVVLASEDMPAEVKRYYDEARGIFGQSPRGAAALLRLGIQKLVIELGEDGDDLNGAIGSLVKKGLSKRIQQSLDIVRGIGNNAVHPGQIVIEDNIEVAMSLFKITNLIVDGIITESKEINELYNNLPEGVRNQISRRDN